MIREYQTQVTIGGRLLDAYGDACLKADGSWERGQPKLGRSLQDLVAFLSELQASNVDLYLDRQGIDTTTPGGKALYQMMGVFAEFERAMIRERVHAGLARARKEGKRLGRPKVSRKIEQRIRAARAEGKGINRIATDLSVGSSTVRRVIRQ